MSNCGVLISRFGGVDVAALSPRLISFDDFFQNVGLYRLCALITAPLGPYSRYPLNLLIYLDILIYINIY